MRLSFKNSFSSSRGMSILSTVALFFPVGGNTRGACQDSCHSGFSCVQPSGDGKRRRVDGADDLVDRRKSRSNGSSAPCTVIESPKSLADSIKLSFSFARVDSGRRSGLEDTGPVSLLLLSLVYVRLLSLGLVFEAIQFFASSNALSAIFSRSGL